MAARLLISTSSPWSVWPRWMRLSGSSASCWVSRPCGGERVVDAVPERVAQLLLGHAAMQGQRGDEDDVVDARLCRHVQHRLDDHLADVRRLHRRQGQGDVVEADGELHAGTQECRQGVAVADGVQQRVADGPVGVVDRLHRARARKSPGCPRAASRA